MIGKNSLVILQRVVVEPKPQISTILAAKLALSLQRCCKVRKSHSHAGREALFFHALAEGGKAIFALCNTSAARVPKKNRTLTAEVLQKCGF